MAGTKCRVLKSKTCRITQPFHNAYQKGYTYYHGGIDLVDFSNGYGALDWITAHSAGTVIGICTSYTGPKQDGSYGNYVWLKHPNGYSTIYAHLSYGTIKVRLGETVKKGQVLGYMGNTGHSFGGHLHWEVRNKNNVRIDPEQYLNADLPGMATSTATKSKKVVKAKAYDLNKKAWLPTVSNNKKTKKTAGNQNHTLAGLALHSPTLKGYCMKEKGSNKFLKVVTGYSTKNAKNGYAGNLTKGAVAIAINDPHAAYQVKIKKTQKWLGVIYGKNFNLKDPEKGYAGNDKDEIDEIRVWRV